MDSFPLTLQASTLKRLRVDHRYRLHTLTTKEFGTILIVCVAQDHIKPCTWGVSYTLTNQELTPQIQRLYFDGAALYRFSQAHNRSLRWLDSSFMLKLCLDRAVRALSSAGIAQNEAPQKCSLADLHILKVNGALPPLDGLLQACREHLTLYGDLREVRDLPSLQID